MSIAFESSDQNRLERLRQMSDEELIRHGKAARSLCRDPKCPRHSSDSWKKCEPNGDAGIPGRQPVSMLEVTLQGDR